MQDIIVQRSTNTARPAKSAMLGEHLAVIRKDDHDGVVEKPGFELIEEVPHEAIDRPDLLIVQFFEIGNIIWGEHDAL